MDYMTFDTVMSIIGMVLFLIAAYFLIKLIIFIFMHYVYSRILSITCGVVFIVLYCIALSGGSVGGGLIMLPLLWLQYMLFIGPSAFDEYWDGTATITIDFDRETVSVKDNFVSMFAVHTAVVIFVGIPFFMWGAEVPFIPLIPCVVVLLMTIIGFIRQLINHFSDY